MVTAVSNASTAVATSSSGSTSSAKAAALAAELAARQSELDDAKTDDEKSSINAEITRLKAEIAELKTSGSQDTQPTAQKTGRSSKDGSTVQVTSADKAAPEGRISGAAMDVLMRLSPQGGMMGRPGGSMDVSQLYSRIDADDDGKVTREEFVKGRGKHMSEDQASALFASIDTANSGSITEDQFAESIRRGSADGGRPMGPPPGGAGHAHGNWNDQAAADATTTIIA